MDKKGTLYWLSLKEYSVKAHGWWWGMLNVLTTTIPLIIAVATYFIWALSTKANPSLPVWNPILLILGIVLFIVFNFLAFHRVRVERDREKAKATANDKECVELRPYKTLYEPIKELSQIKRGDVVKDKVINMSLMLQQLNVKAVDSVTFDHCHFNGPAVMGLVNVNHMEAPRFYGEDIKDIIIEADKTKKYTGICGFVGCTFLYCEFESIGLLANNEDMQRISSGYTQL